MSKKPDKAHAFGLMNMLCITFFIAAAAAAANFHFYYVQNLM